MLVVPKVHRVFRDHRDSREMVVSKGILVPKVLRVTWVRPGILVPKVLRDHRDHKD